MNGSKASFPGEKPAQASRRANFAVAVFLTAIAGFVDALGLLTFARIYTANMSGNSVALGIALNQRQWAECVLRSWPIAFYVAGLILGRSLIQAGARRRARRIASVAFACEVGMLAAAAFWVQPAKGAGDYDAWQYGGIAMLAVSMGIQNAVLTKFSSVTIHSGFVTGTLVQLAEHLVAYGSALLELARRRKSFARALMLSTREKPFGLAIVFGCVWIAYVAGAVAGAWGKGLVEAKALAAPIAGLLLLIGVDGVRPLAIQEEEEQQRLS